MFKLTHHLLQEVVPDYLPSAQVCSQNAQKKVHIAPATVYFNNPRLCLFLSLAVSSL